MNIIEHNKNGLVYLASDGFEAAGGVVHGFSTRLGGVSEGIFSSLNLGMNRGDDPDRVAENYRRFCAAIGADVKGVVCASQVHGDTVRRVVGAVHAGWRGTALGIAARAVERMVDCYGCDRLDILAAIGPGISKCCFETHEDVPNAMTEAMGASALHCIQVLPTGKFRVDLKALNAKRLESAGLDPEHIAISGDCTACLPKKYWSHRITKGERGSQAAMIAIV